MFQAQANQLVARQINCGETMTTRHKNRCRQRNGNTDYESAACCDNGRRRRVQIPGTVCKLSPDGDAPLPPTLHQTVSLPNCLFTKLLRYQNGSLPNGLVGESLCCGFVRAVTAPGTQQSYILTPHKILIPVLRIPDSLTCPWASTETGWSVNTAAARIFE